MQEIWTRINRWLHTHAPQLLDSLQSGASDAQIQAVEAVLSIQFPEDVRASYRICNGQTDDTYGFFDGLEFLSLNRIQEEWEMWKELLDDGSFDDIESKPDPGIRADWWNEQWIPLTHDGGGNHYCLDLNPAAGGTSGQIITMWHDSEEREIIAPSFREWLADYAEGLESGQFVFSEEYDAIINVDDV